jgi:hypothetical protein
VLVRGGTAMRVLVAETCTPVSGQSDLYDCQGMADARRAVAN